MREIMIRTGQLIIQRERKAQEKILQAAVDKGEDMDAPMKLAILQNEIAQGKFAANINVLVQINDSEKHQFGNEWCTYRECNANHSGPVHPAASRQNEARYGLGNSEHMIR
jgi:hypothetical protein